VDCLADCIVWIDCEMIGFDLDCDVLIEVVVLVIDFELEIFGDGVDVVIVSLLELLVTMFDVVWEMYTASGLLDELVNGIFMVEVQEWVFVYVCEYVFEFRKVLLAGNIVGMDCGFFVWDMLEFE